MLTFRDRKGEAISALASFRGPDTLRVERFRNLAASELEKFKELFQAEMKRQMVMRDPEKALQVKLPFESLGEVTPKRGYQCMTEAVTAAATPMSWHMRKRRKE